MIWRLKLLSYRHSNIFHELIELTDGLRVRKLGKVVVLPFL